MKGSRVILLLVLMAVILSGCATGSDQRLTKAEGAAVGAAVGGLAGYLIGDGRGALIGAAAGAGLGYLVGREVAKRKAEYATQEEFLEAEAARTADYNETMRAYNAKSRQELAALEEEVESLRQAYEEGVEEKDTLLARQAEVQKRIQENEELEEELKGELAIQEAIIEEESQTLPEDDPRIAALEKEVQELQANIAALNEGSAQLARIDERLSV
ncbi:glycine zipper domain-containing protein [Desulfonatronospira sp.]|uniref:YMGG-like glycine zipper-containing protein n=1 Tax=Desulfonatronospira sp. TaxID=1962951 RepID=UPI0025BDADF8|nr:glycine zipper domain-containing protein [Desulfonatronospira sp.]